jgi:hypothetical protein
VKVQALESIKDLFKHKYSPRLHFGHRWFTYFGCVSGFSRLVTYFLDGALFQDVAHIDNLPFLGNSQVTLGILSSCVNRQPYLIRTILPFSFLSFLASFNKKVVQVCGDITCPRLWESIQGPLVRLFWWYRFFLFMEDCAPFTF